MNENDKKRVAWNKGISNENDIYFTKEAYHYSKTYGEFKQRLGETYTDEEKEAFWAYFSQQPTHKVKVKKK